MTKEDWVKFRTRQMHFTEAEKAFVKESFMIGRSVTDTAKALSCSRRVISRYFSLYRLEGFVQGGRKTEEQLTRADYTARLYRPSWNENDT